MSFNQLKSFVLNNNNIQLSHNSYRYIDHINKLSTTGFKTRKALMRNKNLIRFDNNTIILMRERYKTNTLT